MFIHFRALWNLNYTNNVNKLVALKACPPSSAGRLCKLHAPSAAHKLLVQLINKKVGSSMTVWFSNLYVYIK